MNVGLTGKNLRMARFLNEGENAVIAAADHGFYYGPIDGVRDLPRALERVKDADGVLITPGMLERCGSVFTGRSRPLLVLRLSWVSSYGDQWGYHKSLQSDLMMPEDALAMGADVGITSCSLNSGDESTDATNLRQYAEFVRRGRQCGLPIVGEFYPGHTEDGPREMLQSQVATVCRIISEIGADAIKTFYTGKNFREIVASTPAPILVLGSGKAATELQSLQHAYDAVNDGARGVFFGRNVMQAKDPKKFLEALKAVVKQGVAPSTAARQFELDA
ncbi:MAG: hypothetical protein IT443_02270 [Phycisphaeraceae bacterium]|nr:hypothetical protein [Phycisphaeraceae bacterium]